MLGLSKGWQVMIIRRRVSRLGDAAWDASISQAGFGELASGDGEDLNYGFGATYKFSDKSEMLFQYQMFEIDDEDVDVDYLSLGFRVNF